MVLIRALPPEDIARHELVIRASLSELFHTEPTSIVLHGYGQEKGIYKVTTPDSSFLAAAAARVKGRTVLQEYNILTQLHTGAPEYFPKPVAHYQPKDVETLGDVYFMEFLTHLDLNKANFDRYSPSKDVRRELAYQIGKAVAAVHTKTGRYSSEPHDGNILAEVTADGHLDIKFCDAIQFRAGSLEDACNAILISKDERPECFRFISKFRDGAAESISSLQGLPLEVAKKQLEFLKRYNSIL